jgi:hypothetical protein
MIVDDIGLLQCPQCKKASLTLSREQKDISGAVRSGSVHCEYCNNIYLIIEYILIALPREQALLLLPEHLRCLFQESSLGQMDYQCKVNNKAIQSALNWEEQFAHSFNLLNQNFENDGFWGEWAFWQFCGLAPEGVRQKTICVYCGGSGREAYHLNKAEPRKIFVVDIGAHIFNIPKLCPDNLDTMVLIMADFFTPILQPGVIDISICDHALQHICDNKMAFEHIVKATSDGGIISVCVYSHENNFVMTHIVEPLKPIMHKCSTNLLRRLSNIFAVMLFSVWLIYKNVGSLFPKIDTMPYYKLFSLWGKDGYAKFHEACFDLLHAPISHHFKKDELLSMGLANHLHVRSLQMINKTMWTMVTQKVK